MRFRLPAAFHINFQVAPKPKGCLKTPKPNLSRSASSKTNKAGNPTTSATAPANTKSATKTAMLPPICAGNRASRFGNWRS